MDSNHPETAYAEEARKTLPDELHNAPLVHLTTADLNNLADGKYDLESIVHELGRAAACVLITPYHLVEWVEKWWNAPDAFVRCMWLPLALPIVAYTPFRRRDVWTADGLVFQSNQGDKILRHFFEGKPYDSPVSEVILSLRRKLINEGEAEFFSRNGQRPQQDKPAVKPEYLKKYLKHNAKHGSTPIKRWKFLQNAQDGLENAADAVSWLTNKPVLSRFTELRSPFGLRDHIRSRAEAFQDWLDEYLKHFLAGFHGVEATHLSFRLWYELREELRRDPSEQGGLAELVDLYEVTYFFECSVITVDKRIEQKLRQVLRRWELDEKGFFDHVVVRCGSDERLLSALQKLPTYPRTA